MIPWLALQRRTIVAILLLPGVLAAADQSPSPKKRGKVVAGLERLLYVTNKSGISIYDINDSHRLLRSFDVPDTASYKGISASVQLGKLYLTSNLKDELVCLDLATEAIDWRRHYSDGYADSRRLLRTERHCTSRCAMAIVGG